MHMIIARSKTVVRQVEELVDSVMDFCLLNPLLHLGGICITLVLILGVHPSLAWLYPSIDKAPDHRWSVQAGPLNQVHQLFNLPGVL